MRKKGLFITFYGINNIGKSTQAQKLVDRLKKAGYKTAFIKYPVYDIEPSGPYINSVLRSGKKQNISEKELQMWFAINRHQFEPKLKKMLNNNTVVVAEDYVGTGLVWGRTKGVPLPLLEAVNSQLIEEDLAILMTGRRSFGAAEEKHIHEQDREMMKKSRRNHMELAHKYGWKVVTRSKDWDVTHDRIWNIVKRFLRTHPHLKK